MCVMACWERCICGPGTLSSAVFWRVTFPIAVSLPETYWKAALSTFILPYILGSLLYFLYFQLHVDKYLNFVLPKVSLQHFLPSMANTGRKIHNQLEVNRKKKFFTKPSCEKLKNNNSNNY